MLPERRRSVIAALLAVALPAAASGWPDAAAAARCPGAGARPEAVSLDTLRSATRCLINNRRARHGLRRLDASRRLYDAARGHSRDMVRHRFFSHVGSDGSTPYERVRRTGYLGRSGSGAVGENLSWGRRAKGRPKAVVRRWMRSSGHRRVILEPVFRDVGIGIVRGSPFKGVRGGATYTAVLGAN